MVIQLFGKWYESKDIACLKYKNIHDEYLVFERSKTERALRNDPKPITIFINDDMRTIIERWAIKINHLIITSFL